MLAYLWCNPKRLGFASYGTTINPNQVMLQKHQLTWRWVTCITISGVKQTTKVHQLQLTTDPGKSHLIFGKTFSRVKPSAKSLSDPVSEKSNWRVTWSQVSVSVFGSRWRNSTCAVHLTLLVQLNHADLFN